MTKLMTGTGSILGASFALGLVVVVAGAGEAQAACTDYDRDGHCSIATGGDDCADNDANRYPGNVEVCDAADHDEDCDPTSYGYEDNDHDYYGDQTCCNSGPGFTWYCGLDVDDANAAIHPGSQWCNGTGSVWINRIYAGLYGLYGYKSSVSCGSGRTCRAQPNGLGVCI